jgi:hypothetical protein
MRRKSAASCISILNGVVQRATLNRQVLLPLHGQKPRFEPQQQ